MSGPPGPPSRFSVSIWVARLKKLSARRKNMSRGRRGPRRRIRWSQSGECEARVAKLKLRLPPSALRPAATAIASISVDLPLPFSPTRNVTFGCSASVSSCRTAGRLNGYASNDGTSSRSRRTWLTNPEEAAVVMFPLTQGSSQQPQLQQGHLAHAALVPPGLPYEADLDVLDARDGGDGFVHLAGDLLRYRAVRGGQGHLDLDDLPATNAAAAASLRACVPQRRRSLRACLRAFRLGRPQVEAVNQAQ